MSFNRIFPLAMALAAVFAAPTPNAPLKRQCNTDPQVPPTPNPVSTASNNTPAFAHTGPWFSTYVDVQTGLASAADWPTPDDLGDWNDFLIAFWMASRDGPTDASQIWAGFDAGDKKQISDAYRAANKTLRIAIFGAVDGDIASQYDPNVIASKVAAFTKENYLHGVDVDYEDSGSFDSTGAGEGFLVQLTKSLRELLPAEEGYILSHAPQAPYFTTAPAYPQGAYRTVHKEVGDLIDFYNIQYYNQGDGVYEDCAGLLTDADGPSQQPGTSVAGILQHSGVPREKLVLGKPAHETDARPGFMERKTLGECIRNAPATGKPGGVMSWQWTKETTEDMKGWIGDARGDL